MAQPGIEPKADSKEAWMTVLKKQGIVLWLLSSIGNVATKQKLYKTKTSSS
jgi:ABC-type spermidine/putrescine transport system permease subunit I